MTPEARAISWLANGQTGLSSKAIVFHMMGQKVENQYDRVAHPHDPADLNRCLLLLEEIPEFKTRLHEMADVSKVWARLVNRWDELEAAFLAEVGRDWCSGRVASKTYDLMQSVMSDKGETQ